MSSKRAEIRRHALLTRLDVAQLLAKQPVEVIQCQFPSLQPLKGTLFLPLPGDVRVDVMERQAPELLRFPCSYNRGPYDHTSHVKKRAFDDHRRGAVQRVSGERATNAFSGYLSGPEAPLLLVPSYAACEGVEIVDVSQAE